MRGGGPIGPRSATQWEVAEPGGEADPPERFADGKARVEGSYPPSGAKVEPGKRVERLPDDFDL